MSGSSSLPMSGLAEKGEGMNPRKKYGITSGGRARMRKYFLAKPNEVNQGWKILAAITLGMVLIAGAAGVAIVAIRLITL